MPIAMAIPAGLAALKLGGAAAAGGGAGALGALAGPLISGGFSAFGAFKQNQAAESLSRETRDWLQMMSGSAHQREVADLRAAGLNPILSATGGAGSSTPSAPTAPVVNELGEAFSSAMSVRMNQEQLANMRSQRALNEAQGENVRAQAALTRAATPVPAAIGDTATAIRDWLTRGTPGAGPSGPGLGPRLRDATPGLEPVRSEATDLMEWISNSARSLGLNADRLWESFQQWRRDNRDRALEERDR